MSLQFFDELMEKQLAATPDYSSAYFIWRGRIGETGKSEEKFGSFRVSAAVQ